MKASDHHEGLQRHTKKKTTVERGIHDVFEDLSTVAE